MVLGIRVFRHVLSSSDRLVAALIEGGVDGQLPARGV